MGAIAPGVIPHGGTYTGNAAAAAAHSDADADMVLAAWTGSAEDAIYFLRPRAG